MLRGGQRQKKPRWKQVCVCVLEARGGESSSLSNENPCAPPHPPTLPSRSPLSHPCLTASQAWRPPGVWFCDGNHGPRQSLCLQRSREGGRPRERSGGTDSSCAGDNRDRPQSTGGHNCLHLHVCHLKKRLQTQGVATPTSHAPCGTNVSGSISDGF